MRLFSKVISFFRQWPSNSPPLTPLPPTCHLIQRREMQFDAGPRRCSWILWQLAPAIRSHKRCLISGPQPSLWRSFLLPEYVIGCISQQPHTRIFLQARTDIKTHECCPVKVYEDWKITNFFNFIHLFFGEDRKNGKGDHRLTEWAWKRWRN